MKEWKVTYNYGQIASAIAGAMREEYKESIYGDDVVFLLDGKPIDTKRLSVEIKG